jgi:hypothetical protein
VKNLKNAAKLPQIQHSKPIIKIWKHHFFADIPFAGCAASRNKFAAEKAQFNFLYCPNFVSLHRQKLPIQQLQIAYNFRRQMHAPRSAYYPR